MPQGYDYERLLDRAFASVPELANENVDFKIPQVDSIVQGSKTILRNFSQIADVARRNPADIAKYLSKEFAAPASTDDQKLTINARVQQQVLNERIKKYFEVYVVCRECHKPDTHIEETSRGYVTLVCEACGARYTIKRS